MEASLLQDPTLSLCHVQPVRPEMLSDGLTADEERTIDEHGINPAVF